MTATLEDVILKRGSSRRFAREPIPFPKLAAILDAVGQPTPLDGPNGVRPLNDAYLLANNVDGLAPGIYRHRPESRSLEHVSSRPTQALAQHLALDQALGGDAAGVLFFVAHLPTVVDTLGARGYRTAHLDASIRAGRGYLAAYALELGATGLTFYDDETVQALGAPAESAVTFLLAVGLAGTKPIR
jgi:nitroreductase